MNILKIAGFQNLERTSCCDRVAQVEADRFSQSTVTMVYIDICRPPRGDRCALRKYIYNLVFEKSPTMSRFSLRRSETDDATSEVDVYKQLSLD